MFSKPKRFTQIMSQFDKVRQDLIKLADHHTGHAATKTDEMNRLAIDVENHKAEADKAQSTAAKIAEMFNL